MKRKNRTKSGRLFLWDKWLSYGLFNLTNHRFGFLMLEWMVHGIPWLIFTITGTLLSIQQKWDQLIQLKFLILLCGILIDLALVGLIKICIQRKRPFYNRNDQVYEAPIADKFSFPSGHSSRASMLAVLLLNIFESEKNLVVWLTTIFPLILGLTRIILGRHYVSDVIAGLILGAFEGYFTLNILPYLFTFNWINWAFNEFEHFFE